MNSNKIKSALWASLLVASSVSQASVIKVTTKEDISRSDVCSLRDAVKAAATPGVRIGGCNVVSYGRHTIQLEADQPEGATTPVPYRLNKTLHITTSVAIQGADTTLKDQPDDVTGTSYSRSMPLTTIQMVNSAGRHFIVGDEGVTLKDLRLLGGKSVLGNESDGIDRKGNGGSIWSTGEVGLSNVRIEGAEAAGGGTIFLAGRSNSFSATQLVLKGNKALNGGSVGMSCYAGGIPTARNLTLQQSLMHENESSAGRGVFDLCGNANLSLSNSTLAKNIGGVVVYRDGAEGISMPPTAAQLSLSQVSIMENQGVAISLPSDPSFISNISVSGSVIGFSTVTADCDLHGGDYGARVSVNENATSTTCELMPANDPATPELDQRFAELDMPDSSVLFSPFALYGGLLEGYLPKAVLRGLPAPNDKLGIIRDRGVKSCASSDQRGAVRSVGAYTACDAGAMELKQLQAADGSGTNRKEKDKPDSAARRVIVDVLGLASASEDATRRYQTEGITLTDNASGRCAVETMQDPAFPDDTTKTKKFLVFSPTLVDGVGELTGEVPVECKYKIQDANPAAAISNEAVAKLTVVNLAPEVKDHSYTRQDNGDRFVMEPLVDAIDPDAPGQRLPSAGVPRPLAEGGPLTKDVCKNGPFIEITEPPKSGRLDESNLMANVVSGSKIIKYHGARLIYKPHSAIAGWSDSFKYVVLDADCEKSNEATVYINVAGRGPDRTGGSPDWLLLLGGLGLLGLRRSRRL